MRDWWCRHGFHKWGESHFIDPGVGSNVRDHKQRCVKCGARRGWVQPKGLDEKYYPVSYSSNWKVLFWVIILAIVMYIILFL